ncbi:hypothetical protein ACFWHT_02025 [Microbacterium sp. NPDC058342]|uniref:hypothetical protein n=1 Tax=Microbacterium sp. NPDC058342 TaxID=3346454 RepID=UPI003656C0B4
MIQIMQLDEDSADLQVKLVLECIDKLNTCLETVASLEEGQTSLLWTADGKSVELTAALKAKYRAGGLWLQELHKQVEEARANLLQAIKDTKLLDDNQKAGYQDLLYRAVGPLTPMKPIAI